MLQSSSLLLLTYLMLVGKSFSACDTVQPFVFGGDLGDTVFEDVDYDSNINIYAGGYSSSSDLTGETAQQPILLKLDIDFTIIWRIYIKTSSAADSISNVVINEPTSEVLTIMGTILAMHNSNDGSLLVINEISRTGVTIILNDILFAGSSWYLGF